MNNLSLVPAATVLLIRDSDATWTRAPSSNKTLSGWITHNHRTSSRPPAGMKSPALSPRRFAGSPSTALCWMACAPSSLSEEAPDESGASFLKCLGAFAQLFWFETRERFVNVFSAASPGDFAAAVTTRWATHDGSPLMWCRLRHLQHIPPGV